ncbi:hypothetical protein AA309_09040 [Microvirga vignae]|uniref:Uncharacterized protein n=1 Tax=Microvirga vignae TaxID=1225564 RepID=A0A0H1RE45_9HYPH|nr:hypothetical protein [Microvirga vignae]KLK93453.1 hypothetical protein AA309_09040 [Microvirga vignae]
MASIPLSLSRLTALAIPALLWVGTAVAQAPDQQSSPDRPKLRQPTPSSVQQQEDVQTNADKSRTEADRKMREMDRRLNRTLRSVCSGC